MSSAFLDRITIASPTLAKSRAKRLRKCSHSVSPCYYYYTCPSCIPFLISPPLLDLHPMQNACRTERAEIGRHACRRSCGGVFLFKVVQDVYVLYSCKCLYCLSSGSHCWSATPAMRALAALPSVLEEVPFVIHLPLASRREPLNRVRWSWISSTQPDIYFISVENDASVPRGKKSSIGRANTCQRRQR